MNGLGCPKCGNENPSTANFCFSCGTALENSGLSTVDEATEVHSAVVAPAGMSINGKVGTISVTRGSNAGSHFVLQEAETTVGRHPDSGIFLDDVTVSRRHAIIRFQNGGFTVSDVSSLNGTYVNGVRIESVELTPGDQLQVGKYLMMFDMEDE